MKKTTLQQNELDSIEKRIMITFFGSDNIPDKTANLLRLLQINPNDIIDKFENIMTPVMKENGMINGVLLKNLIQLSKYKDSVKYFSIPEGDFYLSDIIINLINTFIPGVTE